MTSCGTNKDRLTAAFKTKEQAKVDQQAPELVDKALSVSKLPPQPRECGLRVKSGIELTDALDVALEKTDSALYKANNRLTRCFQFNERSRQ